MKTSASEAPNYGGHGDNHGGIDRAALAGILLLVAAVVALILANSPLAATYNAFFERKLTVGFEGFAISKSIDLWINDGLMAVFFLLVGLEVKRELIEGALSTPRKAALPVLAALGGLVVPALIYFGITSASGANTDGWAIPAATDIAFALGILALLGDRVPVELKVFLTAVAVVDDIGAILIIAFFFTDGIAMLPLAIAGGSLVVLFGLNRAGVRKSLPYALVGIVLWVAVLKTGVHATLAGVALAAFIPATGSVSLDSFLQRAAEALRLPDREGSWFTEEDTFHEVVMLSRNAESLLLRWEHGLQPLVLLFIMPVFAVTNAGVSLGGSGGLGAVGIGVACGLLVGKPIGITLGAWLGVKLRVCDLPDSIGWTKIHAVSWLGGIGFTMSLFITALALDGIDADAAKSGLMLGSLLAGIIGVFLLMRVTKKPTAREDAVSAS